jgi:transposase
MGGKTRPPYAPGFRQQIVDLYASGRRIADLAKEFGCSEQSISAWVKRAGRLSELPDKGAAVMRTHKQARAVAEASALSAKERSELEQLRNTQVFQSDRRPSAFGGGDGGAHEHGVGGILSTACGSDR